MIIVYVLLHRNWWPSFLPCAIYRELAEFGHGNKDLVPRRQLFAGTGTKPAIVFPPPISAQWEEQVIRADSYLAILLRRYTNFICLQIKRLYLLLTVKESAMDVPTNLEARRRISFFTNSLFMDMPRAPRVRKMLSFRFVSYINLSAYCGLALFF
jgi:callose synthase